MEQPTCEEEANLELKLRLILVSRGSPKTQVPTEGSRLEGSPSVTLGATGHPKDLLLLQMGTKYI